MKRLFWTLAFWYFVAKNGSWVVERQPSFNKALHFQSVASSQKESDTWTHIVNVYVGLLCDDTPLCKLYVGLTLGSRSSGTKAVVKRLTEPKPTV